MASPRGRLARAPFGLSKAQQARREVNGGNHLLRRGELSAAVKAFDRAVDIDPGNEVAWNNRGIVLEALGRPEEALRSHNRAIRLRPGYLDAWCNKGIVLMHMGRADRAVECFDTVLRADPHHPAALMNKGVLRSRQGEHFEALSLFNSALEADPPFGLAAFNRGSSLLALRRYDDAVNVYNIALSRRPDFADAWYFKGHALLESEPPQAAFACLLCGTFVDADAKSCSACGAVYEEEAPKAPVLKKERPKRKIRGEFTDSEVEEIARIPGVGRAKAEALCAAGYSALWKIKRASEEELARVRQIGPKGAKAVKDSLKFILLLPRRKSKEEILGAELACPLCGCVTSLFSKACADCGAAFDEEEMDDELRREVRGEHEKGLLAFYDVHGEETPDDADLWYARALLLIDMGELPEALKSIDTAARLNPASRRVMTVRARVLSSMQETTQSAQALRQSLTGLIQKAEPPVHVVEPPDIEDPEAMATFDALESLSALAEKQCPTCGEPVLPDARVCPACGKKLEPVSTLRELAEELLAETPLPEELPAAGAPLAPEPELKKIVKRPPPLPAAAAPAEEEG